MFGRIIRHHNALQCNRHAMACKAVSFQRSIPLLVIVLASNLASLSLAGDDGFGAHGAEFLVNQYLSYEQKDPHVASDRDGNIVVAYYSLGNIWARMFWADGKPRTDEWQVNDTIWPGDQDRPFVMMDPDGEFGVVWNDWDGNDGDLMGVFGRLYDRDGHATSSEFRINDYTGLSQFDPSGAMAPDGSFVVAWSDSGRDGIAGVFARQFAGDGTAMGPSFLVNNPNDRSQVDPSVGMNRDGYFVIAWTDASGWHGEPRDIVARTYLPDGTPFSGEIQVLQDTTGMQRWPAVGMAADRSWVVAWQDEAAHDGSGMGVFARRLTFEGQPLGPELAINETTQGDQGDPSLTCDFAGNFIVTWFDRGSGQSDVMLRRFDADDQPLGPEQDLAADTTGDQVLPQIAIDESGERICAAFESQWDIHARLFERHPVTTRWESVPGFGRGLLVSIHLTGNAGRPYLLAASATPGFVALPGEVHWGLGMDAIFAASFGVEGGPIFYGFAGTLDGNAEGQGMMLDPLPLTRAGFQLRFAALVLDPTESQSVRTATRSVVGPARF